jgi:hypothetical protein
VDDVLDPLEKERPKTVVFPRSFERRDHILPNIHDLVSDLSEHVFVRIIDQIDQSFYFIYVHAPWFRYNDLNCCESTGADKGDQAPKGLFDQQVSVDR